MRSLNALVPSRRETHELLDYPASVGDDLGRNLRDIRRLNYWFGGVRPVVRLVHSLQLGPSASLLDVATGSADIPLALHARTKSANARLEVYACDVSTDVLHEARLVVGDAPITLFQADARHLPYEDQRFSVVTCSLSLHHFSRDDAELVLRELWRVTANTLGVFDLRRSYPGYVATWLATRVIARNRVTKHDGPLSVLRAFTPEELKTLASQAGIESPRVEKYPFFKQGLIAHRSEVSNG